MNNDNSAETIRATTVAAMLPIIPDTENNEIIRLPPGYTLRDLEEYQARPNRIRETVKFRSLFDFCDYVTKFHTPNLAIFAIHDKHTIGACLDWHPGPTVASWRTHWATLTLEYSDTFKAWMDHHRTGTGIRQLTFAEFLEFNTVGIVKPDAATVLEVARTIQGARNVNFMSGHRIQNGDVQFQYVTTTTATAGEKGTIEIPERITVTAPIYKNTNPATFDVRLLWRLGDDKQITFILRIPDFNQIIDAAWDNTILHIQTKLGTKPWDCHPFPAAQDSM